MLLGFESSMFCTTNCVKAHTEMHPAICMENRSMPGDEAVSSSSCEIWSFLKAEASCCHCVTTLYVVLLGGNESINNWSQVVFCAEVKSLSSRMRAALGCCRSCYWRLWHQQEMWEYLQGLLWWLEMCTFRVLNSEICNVPHPTINILPSRSVLLLLGSSNPWHLFVTVPCLPAVKSNDFHLKVTNKSP